MYSTVGHLFRRSQSKIKTLLNLSTISKHDCKNYCRLINPETYKTTVDECMPTFYKLVEELTTKNDKPLQISEHLKKILTYNVPPGKKVRIRITVSAYKILKSNENVTAEDLQLVYILGWCVEMLNSAFLIVDDIMDGSTQRRKAPCWYLVKDVGLSAINDKIMLQYYIFEILNKHLFGRPYYKAIVEFFHYVIHATHFGLSLEYACQYKGGQFSSNIYTWEKYKAIVKYKALYYSLELPLTVALHLSNKYDKNVFERFHNILLEITLLGQIQNDFMDCYGDPSLTGKNGTDIQEGRCTWLLVKALEKSTPAQIKILEENYGKSDVNKVFNVINLYRELNIPNLFLEYKSGVSNVVSTEINKIVHLCPKELFTSIWGIVHKSVNL